MQAYVLTLGNTLVIIYLKSIFWGETVIFSDKITV